MSSEATLISVDDSQNDIYYSFSRPSEYMIFHRMGAQLLNSIISESTTDDDNDEMTIFDDAGIAPPPLPILFVTNRGNFDWSLIKVRCRILGHDIGCPLCAHVQINQQSVYLTDPIECQLCTEVYFPYRLLSCPNCNQKTCILCTYRLLVVMKQEQRTSIVCSFCRFRFDTDVIEYLRLIFYRHADQLVTQLIQPTDAPTIIEENNDGSHDAGSWASSHIILNRALNVASNATTMIDNNQTLLIAIESLQLLSIDSNADLTAISMHHNDRNGITSSLEAIDGDTHEIPPSVTFHTWSLIVIGYTAYIVLIGSLDGYPIFWQRR